jgi:beta-glucanase (GH16 family)
MWQINKDSVHTWYYQDGDEFNEEAISTNEWNYWFGWGRNIYTNKEQQYYSDGKNHFIKDGVLHMYAKHEKVRARLVDWMPDTDSIKVDNRFDGYNLRDYNYTAGMLQSKKTYLYGYFEIKFKTPPEKGFWPAFWLYGGGPNEEIDWMELKTEKDNQIHVGRHSQKKEENKIRDVFRKKWWGDWVKFKGSLSKEYNILSGEWTPGYLKYYLNGECIAYTELGMHIPKNLVANIAVPGVKGSFHPAPDTSIKQSSDFEIDYIRVWSKDPQQANVTGKEKLSASSKKQPVTNLSTSKLKSKGKFLYGKKSVHKNEGITVSFVPQGNGFYHLIVLGKEIPADAVYELNVNGSAQSSGQLKYGTNEFELTPQRSQARELVIKCYGQTVRYTIR